MIKPIFTACLLFACLLCFGQTYKFIVGEANALYENKDDKKSVEKYNEIFKLVQKSALVCYDAGCSAALAGEKTLALE